MLIRLGDCWINSDKITYLSRHGAGMYRVKLDNGEDLSIPPDNADFSAWLASVAAPAKPPPQPAPVAPMPTEPPSGPGVGYVRGRRDWAEVVIRMDLGTGSLVACSLDGKEKVRLDDPIFDGAEWRVVARPTEPSNERDLI